MVRGSLALARKGKYEILPAAMRRYIPQLVQETDPRRPARYLVVGPPDEVYGFTFLMACPSDFCPPLKWWIETLFVFRPHRRQGIAQALMEACERIVLDADSDRVHLHCALGNREALPKYIRNGYHATDDVLMCKLLRGQASRRAVRVRVPA
jgi:GNAT superfamily N-acetyltransferase